MKIALPLTLAFALLLAGCPPPLPLSSTAVAVKPTAPAPTPRPKSSLPDPGISTPPQLERVSWLGEGDLLSVAALSSAQALAVGVPGAAWIDGSQVRVAPFPDGIADSVWADGPSFALAVGYGGMAHVWNGKSWTPAPTNTDADLHAVWGRGKGKSRQIFAGGSRGVLLSWNDGTWTRMKAPENANISAFAGAGEAVWAVGQTSAGEPADGVILRLVGDAWVDACRELTCGSAIYSAWASSPKDFWTVGAAGELVHYANGGAEMLKSGTRGAITAIWGTGSADLFVAGDGGFFLHWNGRSWSPLPAGEEDVRSLSGLPSGEGWLVGSGGSIHRLRRLPAPPLRTGS